MVRRDLHFEVEFMRMELNVSHFRNGEPIEHAQSLEAWNLACELGKPAYCEFFLPDNTVVSTAKLYNRHALVDPRVLAPPNWRIAVQRDWLLLQQKFNRKIDPETIPTCIFGATQELNGLVFTYMGFRDTEGEFQSDEPKVIYWAGTDKDETGDIPVYTYSFESHQLEKLHSRAANSGFLVRCVKEVAEKDRLARIDGDSQGEKNHVMACYVKGMNAMYAEIKSKLVYPKEAKIEGFEGIVYVEFYIDTEGNVQNVKCLRGIGYGCDEEAVRVIKTLGKWYPTIKDGQAIEQQLAIPIVFKYRKPWYKRLF